MRKILAIALLTTTACDSAPSLTPKMTGNPKVDADVVAEIDGCRVYRVKEPNERVYRFVRCPRLDDVSTHETWTEQRGKTQVTVEGTTQTIAVEQKP